MKKATWIIFIFAVLMIALLVSCNTTPDPLPDETTAADPTSEITTAEESIEERITTEAETSAELTTEAVTYETDMNGYPFISADPIEKTEGTVTIADTETPWYITEWEPVSGSLSEDVPEEKQNLAFRFPKTTRVETNELIVTVDFFQEYYRFGDPVQVQIKVESKCDQTIHLAHGLFGTAQSSQWHRYFVSVVENESGASGTPHLTASTKPLGYIRIACFGDSPDLPGRYNQSTYIDAIRYMNTIQYEIHPGTAKDPGNRFRNVFENGVMTVEYLMTMQPEEFDIEKNYDFLLQLVGYAEGAEEKDLPYRYLRIPMEIVEYESVSP